MTNPGTRTRGPLAFPPVSLRSCFLIFIARRVPVFSFTCWLLRAGLRFSVLSLSFPFLYGFGVLHMASLSHSIIPFHLLRSSSVWRCVASVTFLSSPFLSFPSAISLPALCLRGDVIVTLFFACGPPITPAHAPNTAMVIYREADLYVNDLSSGL